MCGISGIVFKDNRPVESGLIEQMTDSLSSRGPDAKGVFIDDNMAVGHRRLSIIDLEGGIQPFANEEKGLYLTYNGEIYNFRELRDELKGVGYTFETASDTETLLRAYEHWGEECPSKLRGCLLLLF